MWLMWKCDGGKRTRGCGEGEKAGRGEGETRGTGKAQRGRPLKCFNGSAASLAVSFWLTVESAKI